MIPSPCFGLNFDPSHFVWQQMDYIQPLYEFKDRLFHVHYKGYQGVSERLSQCGVMAPFEYMAPKLPGLGDVDWSRWFSALYDIGYQGGVCIEVEDRAFESSRESILDSYPAVKTLFKPIYCVKNSISAIISGKRLATRLQGKGAG